MHIVFTSCAIQFCDVITIQNQNLKQTIMKQLMIASLAALLLSSCKKEITDSISSQQQSNQVNSRLHPMGVKLDDPSLVKKVGYYSIPKNSLNKAPLPSYIDLSMYMPKVGSQGTQLSCVGWAVGYYCKSYQEGREKNWGVDQNTYSPSWVYNQINGGVDDGSQISNAMDLLVNKGCDFIDNFSYSSSNYTTQPDIASKTNAAHYKSLMWQYLVPLPEIFKAMLSTSQVIVISIPVYPDFDISPENLIYDDWFGASDGDHAICIIGYDDSKQAFKFINSWGTDYGINGYGWISYDKIPDINAAYVLIDKANSYDTQYLIGDFNGDKVQDIFTANGNAFYVSWSGVNGLKKLQTSTATITNLIVGDFNGDGQSDILYPDGSNFYVLYSGTGMWYKLKSSTQTKSELAIGDFNGDGKSDVFYPNGTKWYVSYSGTGIWEILNSSSKKYNLLLGDFNGDGKTDVFYPDGTDWYVCYSGVGVWTKVNSSSVIFNLAVGDFNGDGKSDIFYSSGTGWYVCYSGMGGFAKFSTSSLKASELQLTNYNTGRFGDNKYDVIHATSSKWEISWSGTSAFSAL